LAETSISETFDFKQTLVETIPHLRAFARSLTHNRDLADDLVHEAVVRALSASDHFTPGTNFRAWMFTILRNQYYNERRKWQSRAVPYDETLMKSQRQDSQQESRLEFSDFRRAFWQLTPDQREVLMLVGASGLSYEKAAEICGCRVGTIKSRVSRARTDLRRILETDSVVMQRCDITAEGHWKLLEIIIEDS